MNDHELRLSNSDGPAEAVVDLKAGGRLSSLVVGGHELLVDRVADALNWGLYPMVPFAGRVRGGMVEFGNETVQLPATNGPHAIHGYGFVNEWALVGPTEIRYSFGPPWPWQGVATQRFLLEADSLTIEMHVAAVDRQPMQVGWHPWFRRDIGTGYSAELAFDAGLMFERDATGIPTGRTVAPPAGPWDDCFAQVTKPPRVSWGGFAVELSSSATCWTVYDEPSHALCVEPQTGPPNQINDDPMVLDAGQELTETFTISWKS